MRAAVVLLALALSGCFGGSDFTWPDVQPQQCDDSAGAGLRCETVAIGFGSSLVQVVGTAGELYVVEQDGIIWRMDGDRPHEDPVLDLRNKVATCHYEQGLLGLAFAPDWPEDPRAYVAYTEDKPCDVKGRFGKGDLVLARYTASSTGADGDPAARADDGAGVRLDPGSHEELLRVPEPYRNHNGGHVAFGPDGMLYLGVGDGGDHSDPLATGPDPTDLLASILRIDVRPSTGYAVPTDNPFAPGGDRAGDGAPEVFLYGVRNPWRFTFDGDVLWVADVGQDCFEEIDRLSLAEASGAFLGWSQAEGSHPFDRSAAGNCGTAAAALADGAGVPPIHEYRHGPEGHCSVTGGPVLRGTAAAGLGLTDGTYLFGDFCTGRLWALVPDGDAYRDEHLFDTGLQLTSMGLVDDTVYLLHWNGSLHRLVADAA